MRIVGTMRTPAEHRAMADLKDRIRGVRRPNKMRAPENLEHLTNAELADLCEAKGIEVTRTDGKAGRPRKSDYIAALT